MKQTVLPLLVLLVSSAVSAQDPRDRENPGYRDPWLSEPGQIAPLLEGLGEHHHPITARELPGQDSKYPPAKPGALIL